MQTISNYKAEIITQEEITFSKSNLPEEEIVQEAHKSLERSIGILNIVATLIGVLVGLITLIFIIATAFGFFEVRKWGNIRKEAEKYAKEIKKLEEEVKPIIDIIKKVEEEVNNMRGQIKVPLLTEVPSDEIRKKLDEYGKKLEFLEAFGVQLKSV